MAEMNVAFTLVAMGVGLLPLLLWWTGRLKNRAWDDWQTILDAKGHRAYRTLRERMGWDREIIDHTYGKAMTARYLGSVDEAARMLDIGYQFLADTAEERSHLLGQLAHYTRMITSFLPAAPVPARPFRSTKLRTLARIGFLFHHFLVTAQERFQLRVCIVRLGFRVVLRTILRSRSRALKPSPDVAWERINAGREDFHALSDETLECLRVLLLSLAAHRESGIALQRI